MGEDAIAARLDRMDAKLDKLDGKIDDQRRELQANSKETHGKMYERIEALENEAAENRHVIAAMKEHMAKDMPFEVSWRQKAYQIMLFVLTSGIGAFVAILIARWTR